MILYAQIYLLVMTSYFLMTVGVYLGEKKLGYAAFSLVVAIGALVAAWGLR